MTDAGFDHIKHSTYFDLFRTLEDLVMQCQSEAKALTFNAGLLVRLLRHEIMCSERVVSVGSDVRLKKGGNLLRNFFAYFQNHEPNE